MARHQIVFLALCCLLIGASAPAASAQEPAAVQGQRPGFPAVLGQGRIEFGSVTLADLDNDSRPEILVGSANGILYVVNQNGSLRWQFNVSQALYGAAAGVPGLRTSGGASPIRSAPAVANVSGDSRPEIFVSAGDILSAEGHGGVVGLSASGSLLPGWPQLTCDVGDNTPPPSFTPQLSCAQLNGGNGFTSGVVSSPAVGDIDGDGGMEVVYGAFDQLTYARNADGGMVPGWPQHALDTIWSSPALADLTGDGVAEVIIGVDAQNYNGPSWNAIPRQTVAGGYMMAYRGNGAILWAAHQDEIVQSSPAVADLDADGQMEIVAGTGQFYSISNPALGRYVTAWNHDGTVRWRTPLPSQVVGSPAIGDLNGDGQLDVVVGATNRVVYAFNGASGQILWQTPPRDIFNSPGDVTSPVLGDFDGDGRDDVFLTLAWEVTVLKGTSGQQLTATAVEETGRPSFYGGYLGLNTPALGDLDGDGRLDLVFASGNTDGRAQVNSWRLPNSSLKASWPMFRRTPDHRAVFAASCTGPRARFDFNGDCRADILWRNSSNGNNAVWYVNGTAVTSNSSPRVADQSWRPAGVGDINNDRRADIIWRNSSTGANTVWFMNGATSGATRSLPTVSDANWRVAGTGDFNGDGRSDLLWRHASNGANAIWTVTNTGAATGYNITRVADLNWQIAGTGDFNGDGRADILWRNNSTGANTIWFMNGTSATARAIRAVSDLNWKIAGAGDYNADNRSDILWRNSSNGDNTIWLMNGTSVSARSISGVNSQSWQVAFDGDFNGDRKADILWRNNSTGANTIWFMNGATRASSASITTVGTSWRIIGNSSIGTGPSNGPAEAPADAEAAEPATSEASEVLLGDEPVEMALDAGDLGEAMVLEAPAEPLPADGEPSQAPGATIYLPALRR